MKTSTLSRALVLGAASVPALTAVSCDKMPERKPNVIFILMDDAGYGDFGCYGQTRIETPNIDSLAARGIRFTDMYSAAPLSSPARCGLLTGMHTGHAQIRANDEMTARGDVWNHEAMLRDSTLEGQAPLKAGTPTLGSVMRQGGYRTLHSKVSGVENIDLINFFFCGGADPIGGALATNGVKQGLPLFFAELFGVVDPLNHLPRAEHHRRCVHRTCQGTSPGFINTTDAGVALCAGLIFKCCPFHHSGSSRVIRPSFPPLNSSATITADRL